MNAHWKHIGTCVLPGQIRVLNIRPLDSEPISLQKRTVAIELNGQTSLSFARNCRVEIDILLKPGDHTTQIRIFFMTWTLNVSRIQIERLYLEDKLCLDGGIGRNSWDDASLLVPCHCHYKHFHSKYSINNFIVPTILIHSFPNNEEVCNWSETVQVAVQYGQ